jgi:tetratricopeptide (TPR) repeat protein
MWVSLVAALLATAAPQDSVGVGSYAIRGMVVSELGTVPASAFTVALVKSDGTSVGRTFTDDTGKFSFRGLTKGAYDVVVEIEGRAPLKERVAMNTQNQVYEVQIYVRPSAAERRAAGEAVNVAYLKLPASVRSQFDRAVRESGAGKHARSVDLLTKVVAAQPDFAPAYNQLGIDLYNLSRRDEAARAFRRSAELDPRSAHAFVNLGKLMNESGEHLQAIELLKSAVTVDPASCPGFFQLGVAYYHLNSLLVSERYLRRALELDSARRFPIRLELANLYLKRRQMQLAAEELRAFLAESPQAPQAAEVRRTLEKLAAAGKP